MNTQRYPGEEFDDMARDLLLTDYQNPPPQDRYHLVVVGRGLRANQRHRGGRFRCKGCLD